MHHLSIDPFVHQTHVLIPFFVLLVIIYSIYVKHLLFEEYRLKFKLISPQELKIQPLGLLGLFNCLLVLFYGVVGSPR